MSERAKLSVLSALLLFALVFAAFTAANTVQAVRNLQLQNNGIRVGNVSTIRVWMTIHAISRIYHVPEDYLYRSLDISRTTSFHHATLYEIASRKQQPANQVISTIQRAILTYRKEHPPGKSTPTRAHHSSIKLLSSALGRAEP